MARELRATRYLRPGNEGLAQFISSELHYLDYPTTLAFYDDFANRNPTTTDIALLGANDRFFLTTGLLQRKDALHPWLFDRCREVEAEPDDCLDLWSREHYKSSFITFAGSIQEVVIDPEITIGIFSFNKEIAAKFVDQIKEELQRNELLKQCYPDVFYEKPESESPLWSTAKGLKVRRKTNPKEATWEPHGLTKGQPIGRHFALRIYDDIITLDFVTNPKMVDKATQGWELSDNLGSNQPGKPARRWHIGTRYSFADTYGVILDRKILKPRIYPATDNGKITGKPVFFEQSVWEEKKKTQKSTLSAQLLQNPAAGNEAMFRMEWFKSYLIRPAVLNVYIMGDPSKGDVSTDSDNTAIVVIGYDANGNKYLLDGYCHKMRQSERWSNLKRLRRKWVNMPGVQSVSVGWERYGQESDKEYFEEKMKLDGNIFDLAELNWTRKGGQSKTDRVERLQPHIEDGSFFFSHRVWHETYIDALWTADLDQTIFAHKSLISQESGKVIKTKQMRAMEAQDQPYRIAAPIKRQDEQGAIYDLTRKALEELLYFPFGAKKDLVDAMSRFFDMDPVKPMMLEREAMDLADVADYPDS